MNFKYDLRSTEHTFVTTCLTNLDNSLASNSQFSFRIFAFLTQNKFLDVAIKNVLEFTIIVRSVYNISLICIINVSLSPEFDTEVFSWI